MSAVTRRANTEKRRISHDGNQDETTGQGILDMALLLWQIVVQTRRL